jgi:hypothetical protein
MIKRAVPGIGYRIAFSVVVKNIAAYLELVTDAGWRVVESTSDYGALRRQRRRVCQFAP